MNSLNSPVFNFIPWHLASREYFLCMCNRILHVGIHTLQILLASCSIHYHFITLHIVCSFNMLRKSLSPIAVIIPVDLSKLLMIYKSLCGTGALNQRQYSMCLVPNRSGLVCAGGWHLVGSPIIMMKKQQQPGNQTFRIYLDSFTRHIVFFPCFPRCSTEIPHG